MSVSSPTPNLGPDLIKLFIADMQLLAFKHYDPMALPIRPVCCSYGVLTLKITNAAQKLHFAGNLASISQRRTEVGVVWVVQPPPPNSEVLTKSNRIAN